MKVDLPDHVDEDAFPLLDGEEILISREIKNGVVDGFVRQMIVKSEIDSAEELHAQTVEHLESEGWEVWPQSSPRVADLGAAGKMPRLPMNGLATSPDGDISAGFTPIRPGFDDYFDTDGLDREFLVDLRRLDENRALIVQMVGLRSVEEALPP